MNHIKRISVLCLLIMFIFPTLAGTTQYSEPLKSRASYKKNQTPKKHSYSHKKKCKNKKCQNKKCRKKHCKNYHCHNKYCHKKQCHKKHCHKARVHQTHWRHHHRYPGPVDKFGQPFGKPYEITYIFAPVFSHINYTETVRNNFFVRDKGNMFGLYAAWQYRQPHVLVLKLDLSAQSGEMDYKGAGDSGRMSGHRDYLIDFRGVLGKDLFLGGHRITPYLGAGYRHLDDDSSDVETTTGMVGYDRKSNYYYSPVGIELSLFDRPLWSLKATGEYDHFWRGIQKTYLGAFTRTALTNDQRSGHGYRGNIELARQTDNGMKIFFQPYYNFWHVRDSESACVETIIEGIDFCGREPSNKTRAYGIRIGAIF